MHNYIHIDRYVYLYVSFCVAGLSLPSSSPLISVSSGSLWNLNIRNPKTVIPLQFLEQITHTYKHTQRAGTSQVPIAILLYPEPQLLETLRHSCTHSWPLETPLLFTCSPAWCSVLMTHPHSPQPRHHGHPAAPALGLAPVTALTPLCTHVYTQNKESLTQEIVRKEFNEKTGQTADQAWGMARHTGWPAHSLHTSPFVLHTPQISHSCSSLNHLNISLFPPLIPPPKSCEMPNCLSHASHERSRP